MVNITDEQNGQESLAPKDPSLYKPEDGDNPGTGISGRFTLPEDRAEFLRQHPVHSDEQFPASEELLKKASELDSQKGPTNELSFGEAIEAIKQGKKAYRSGWNGKGMFIAYSPGMEQFPAQGFWSPVNQQYAMDNGGFATVLPSITMKTATGEILMGWNPTNADVLSNDWIVE